MRIIIALFLATIFKFSSNAQPAVGFETPFTQELKTNVDAAGWRDALSVAPPTTNFYGLHLTNNITFEGGISQGWDNVGIKYFSSSGPLFMRMNTNGVFQSFNAALGGFSFANSSVGIAGDASFNRSLSASNLNIGSGAFTVVNGGGGEALGPWTYDTNVDIEGILTINDASATNAPPTFKQMTNYVALKIPSGLPNYMVQAQTNFTALTNGWYSLVYSGGNATNFSGLIEIITTNGGSQSSLFSYGLDPSDEVGQITQLSSSQSVLDQIRITANDSDARIDIHINNGPSTNMVAKIYGNNAGYFGISNNAVSISTDRTITLNPSLTVSSGGATFGGDVTQQNSQANGNLVVYGSINPQTVINMLDGEPINLDSAGSSLTANAGAVTFIAGESLAVNGGPTEFSNDLKVDGVFNGTNGANIYGTNVPLLNATQKFTGAITATNAGNNIAVNSSSIVHTLSQTNILINQLYTNTTSGPFMVVGVAAALVEAAVAGRASVQVQISGQFTNTPLASITSAVGTIVGSDTNALPSYVVPSGSIYKFTDTSTGTGNSVTLVGGQIFQ